MTHSGQTSDHVLAVQQSPATDVCAILSEAETAEGPADSEQFGPAAGDQRCPDSISP